eukprot:Skav204929  [mRNA]  locus=scaffold553:73292:74048:+ [translate_table: standard]
MNFRQCHLFEMFPYTVPTRALPSGITAIKAFMSTFRLLPNLHNAFLFIILILNWFTHLSLDCLKGGRRLHFL